MQVTVTIPDAFAVVAQARGQSPESYVLELIDKAVREPAPFLEARPGDRDMRRFFREMASHSAKMPELPEAAFERESFYQDHD